MWARSIAKLILRVVDLAAKKGVDLLAPAPRHTKRWAGHLILKPTCNNKQFT